MLIECSEHLPDPTQLSDERFAAVFRAYRDRMRALADDSRLAYAAVFKNVGAEAGASLGHTHSQIIATPVVPELVEVELAAAREFFARTGRCVFCDLAARELMAGERVIAHSEHFLAVAAYAPRYAYEFWVLPLDHSARYETITDDARTNSRSHERVLVGSTARRANRRTTGSFTRPRCSPSCLTTTGTSRCCREPRGPRGLEGVRLLHHDRGTGAGGGETAGAGDTGTGRPAADEVLVPVDLLSERTGADRERLSG